MRWHYALGYLDPKRAIKIRKRIDRTRNPALRRPERILLLFTADTEYVPPWKSGSWCHVGADAENLRGLDIIRPILKANSMKGTFLLEGILAKNDPKVVLGLLSDEHEIGYHGYAHESYGGNWQTKTAEQPSVLSKEEVRVKIASGKEIIKNLTGKPPESFVAPFHHVRRSTLKILGDEGFRVDSSVYNHLYGISEPFEITCSNRSIIEIPFSTPLRPRWRVHLSPFFPTILEAAETDFEHTMEDIGLPEDVRNDCLCILVTCHPWEFSNENDSKSKTLRKFLDDLIGKRKAEAITMREFPQYFQKEFKDPTIYAI